MNEIDSPKQHRDQVLWLGGMSGVGKTTAARKLARRYDLWLYSLDARTYEHAQKLPADPRSLDELWVDASPEALADWFEQSARDRFDLVLDDLAAFPDDAPVIVDGPQLLPDLVSPHLASQQSALFVIAKPDLQRRLVTARGSDLYARTRDPERALENRLLRDEALAQRLREAAAEHGLTILEVGEVSETAKMVDDHLTPLLAEWISQPAHGDVAVRRREENDARLRQWRAHADATGATPSRQVEFACECDRPGCDLTIAATLTEAEAARAQSLPLSAPTHSVHDGAANALVDASVRP